MISYHEYPFKLSTQLVLITQPYANTLSYVDIIFYPLYPMLMPLISPKTSAFLLSIFFFVFPPFLRAAFAPRFSVNWQKVCKKNVVIDKKTTQNLKFVSKGGEFFSQNISSKIGYFLLR